MIKRQNKILESKIEPPTLFRNFVVRDSLFEQLRNKTEKVIVLNAGAGFGKTMLLTFYALKTDEACAWYHLNSMDNDIISFVQYLSKSVSKAVAEFEFDLDNYQNQDIDHEFARSIAYDFAYQLSSLEEDIVIILDDFQKINNEDIFTILSILISNTADNVKFLLSMKSAFPKFLARYLLQGTAMVVSAQELAFNKEEIIYILQDIPNILDTDELADAILNYTEGWPVGVMSAVLGLRQERRSVSKNDIVSLCRESTAYDYIMYEVYRKLPYDMQIFLKNTSVLNIVSANICNAIMSINNAQNILDYLVQENLFVIKLSGTGHVFQYHSIFKDFLKSFLTEDMKKDIYNKAAKYCLNSSEYKEQAAEYAMQSSNCEIIQDTLELIGIRMVQTGKLNTLKRWVDFLVEGCCRLRASTKFFIGSYYFEEKHYKQALYYFTNAADSYLNDKNEEGYVKSILQKIAIIQVEENAKKALSYLTEVWDSQKKSGIIIKYAFSLKKAELCLLLNEMEMVEQICNDLFYEPIKITENGEYLNTLKENIRLICRYFNNKSEDLNLEITEAEQLHLYNEFPVFYDYSQWAKIYDEYRNSKSGAVKSQTEKILSIWHEENIFIIHMKLLVGFEKWKIGDKTSAIEVINHCTDFYESNGIEIPILIEEDRTILIQIAENVKFQIDNTSKKYLKVTCFGEFLVYMNGTGVKWRTKKAKEMFAFLINRNGKPVDREIITEALWPESFYNNTISLFHTTVSYLRKALSVGGYQDMIKVSNKKYYLDIEQINSDCQEFLRIFDYIVNENWDKIDRQKDALFMYTGEYFSDLECDWHISKKEKYERLYLKACNVLAEHNMKQSRYDDAINYLIKALDIDPYSENLSALLIRCYGAIGDIKRVKLQYEKTKQILREELNVGLSEIMLTAYKESMP